MLCTLCVCVYHATHNRLRISHNIIMLTLLKYVNQNLNPLWKCKPLNNIHTIIIQIVNEKIVASHYKVCLVTLSRISIPPKIRISTINITLSSWRYNNMHIIHVPYTQKYCCAKFILVILAQTCDIKKCDFWFDSLKCLFRWLKTLLVGFQFAFVISIAKLPNQNYVAPLCLHLQYKQIHKVTKWIPAVKP